MTIACLLIHENITREFNEVLALPVGRERKTFCLPSEPIGSPAKSLLNEWHKTKTDLTKDKEWFTRSSFLTAKARYLKH